MSSELRSSQERGRTFFTKQLYPPLGLLILFPRPRFYVFVSQSFYIPIPSFSRRFLAVLSQPQRFKFHFPSETIV